CVAWALRSWLDPLPSIKIVGHVQGVIEQLGSPRRTHILGRIVRQQPYPCALSSTIAATMQWCHDQHELTIAEPDPAHAMDNRFMMQCDGRPRLRAIFGGDKIVDRSRIFR